MNEWEKAQAGYLYDANYDSDLLKKRTECADLCFEFNMCRPSDTKNQEVILRKLLGETNELFTITQPFYCDYGSNIKIGNNFYSNNNLVILDAAPVEFGDNVFIGPNCTFTTAGHPLDVEQRNAGLEIALPIKVGNNVWIGANVIVLPGVEIGDNCVIGAGSVVTKSIESDMLAFGNPCKEIRRITDEDKSKYINLED